MKVSQINFNLSNSNLKFQKVFSNQIVTNMNFKSQDTFSKTDCFSNKDAMNLLKTKLQEYMTPSELDVYMTKVENFCKKLGIEPKNLPISKEHPGNLEDYQYSQISFLVKEDAIST